MFGKKKPTNTSVESIAEATAQQRPTAAVEVQLPNPPARIPPANLGASDARAEQDALNLLASGAIDATTVTALTQPFPPQTTIDKRAGVDIAGIKGERAEAEAGAEALITRAEQGDFVTPSKHAPNGSAAGVKATLESVEADLEETTNAHVKSGAVLDGTADEPDGSHRPGKRIAPNSDRPERALLWSGCAPLLRLFLLGLVEAVVITGNQIAYLRLPDSQAWHGVAIALVAVLLLTYAPHYAGHLVGPVLHGAPLTRRAVIGPIAIGVVWLAAAVAAALVRVDVDRAAAIRAAEDERARTVKQLVTLNPGADPNTIPPIDPSSVFDSTLPIVMWLGFLVGMGVVFAVTEAYSNPARVDELRYRVRVKVLTEKRIALKAQDQAIADSVALQRGMKTQVLAMWDAQERVIIAGADHSEAIFEQVLAEASGDPDMLLALERHRTEVARRSAERKSEGEDR